MVQIHLAVSEHWVIYTCQGAQTVIPSELGIPKRNYACSRLTGGEKIGVQRAATCQVTSWEAEPSTHQLHSDVPMPETMHNILDTVKNTSGQAVATDCGENTPPRCNILAACKSEAAISLWCAAGICTKANPKCFVILPSSNPISISGHSINRIKTRLKVIIRPVHPQGAGPAWADAAITTQPSPTLPASAQGFHHRSDLGWPELQTGQPMFSITTQM